MAVLFIAGLSVYGPPLLIALFYQDVQGKSALIAGLLLAPQGTGSLVPGPWSLRAARDNRRTSSPAAGRRITSAVTAHLADARNRSPTPDSQLSAYGAS